MFFVAFFFFLRHVAGTPPLQNSFNGKPNEVRPLPLQSTSPGSSLMSFAPDSQILSSFSSSLSSHSRTPLSLIASATPPLVHHQTVEHVHPSITTKPQSLSASIVSVAPLVTHLSLDTPHTEGLTTQQSHLISSSSLAVESFFPVSAPVNGSSPASLSTTTNPTTTIRFALIGVLAGVPMLTILGFFITIRWRRTRVAEKLGMMKIPSDYPDLSFKNKERKGTRFSSFFGVNNTGILSSKDLDGRKHCGTMYASSIHSTAGLAGVGARRGASAKSVPPMIHYINVTDIGLDGELQKKANFDNPFGTPPPVCAGFVIAPSRVSPHLPQTSPQLINLPPLPPAAHRHVYAGQVGSTGLAISHPMAIPSQTFAPRSPTHFQTRGQNEQLCERAKDSAPPHVRCQQKPPSSSLRLSPDVADHLYTRSRIHPILPNSHRYRAPDVRISVSPSVYGGIASPASPAYKIRPQKLSPVLSYITSSPKPEHTPVLPYLSSPMSGSHRPEECRQSVGPIIVIKVSSPTMDSESEYEDTDGGDETGGLYANEGSAHVRRTGLIGSPRGFVAPSSTFSSVSSYSIPPSGGSGAASSTSTILPHESSTSSALVLSSSSSGASSITVKAVVPRVIRMRDPNPKEGRVVHRAGVSWSQHSKVSKPDLDGLRGIAF